MSLLNGTKQRTQEALKGLASFVINFMIVWLLATALLFVLLDVLPGDAASNQIGRAGEEAVRLLRQEMGLDKPLPQRYAGWLCGLLTGDLGKSYVTQKSVLEIIRIPVLSSLTVSGIVFIGLLCFTLPLAVFCAYYKNVWTKSISKLSVLLASIPEIILTVLILLMLSLQWRVLPVISNPGPGESVWTRPISMVLPSICLWLICSVSMFRHLKVMIEEYAATAYVREARISGLSARRVLFVHLLPSAAGGIAQVFASTIPYLLGGSMVVESVTAFPGMGYTLVSAIQNRESLVVMALGSILIDFSFVSYYLADRFGRRNAQKGGSE